MGNCFRSIGILCEDTADAKGQQRFLGKDPYWMAAFPGTHGKFRRAYEFWGKTHGFKAGIDLISEQTVAFHNLKTPTSIKRVHAILHKSCPSDSSVGKALQ